MLTGKNIIFKLKVLVLSIQTEYFFLRYFLVTLYLCRLNLRFLALWTFVHRSGETFATWRLCLPRALSIVEYYLVQYENIPFHSVFCRGLWPSRSTFTHNSNILQSQQTAVPAQVFKMSLEVMNGFMKSFCTNEKLNYCSFLCLNSGSKILKYNFIARKLHASFFFIFFSISFPCFSVRQSTVNYRVSYLSQSFQFRGCRWEER